MEKFHFDIKLTTQDKTNAGSKATTDATQILLGAGFHNLELHFTKSPWLLPYNLIRLSVSLLRYARRIPNGSLLVVQYPLKGINKAFGFFLKLLQRKGCKCCCLIHDLDSLRGTGDASATSHEMRMLSAYDAVICHNVSMGNWLRQNSYEGCIIKIGLFDYLLPSAQTESKVWPLPPYTTVIFAGNLSRGNFLPEWIHTQPNIRLHLYGSGFNGHMATGHDFVAWKGSYAADEIAEYLQGHWGLIWDGDSIHELAGPMGTYQQYNTPHKTSLYLVAGLPVIVAVNAAIAPFIHQHQLGLLVECLTDIPDAIRKVSNDMYRIMCSNVAIIREQLLNGDFLTNAVYKATDKLYSE